MNASELDFDLLHRGLYVSYASGYAIAEGRWIRVATTDTHERAEALLMRHVDPLRRSIMAIVPLEIGTGDSATWLRAFVSHEAQGRLGHGSQKPDPLRRGAVL